MKNLFLFVFPVLLIFPDHSIAAQEDPLGWITSLVVDDEVATDFSGYLCVTREIDGLEDCYLSAQEELFEGDILSLGSREVHRDLVMEIFCGRKTLLNFHQNFEAVVLASREHDCSLEVIKGSVDVLSAGRVRVYAAGTVIGTAGTHFAVHVYPNAADDDYKLYVQLFEGALFFERWDAFQRLSQGFSFDWARRKQSIEPFELEAFARTNARVDLARAQEKFPRMSEDELRSLRRELNFLHERVLEFPSSHEARRALSNLQNELGLLDRAAIGLEQLENRLERRSTLPRRPDTEGGSGHDERPRRDDMRGGEEPTRPRPEEAKPTEAEPTEAESPPTPPEVEGPVYTVDPLESAIEKIRFWAKRDGSVWLEIPTRRWSGMPFSGRLTISPEGRGNAERRNREDLERMRLVIGGQEIPVRDGSFTFDFPSTTEAEVVLVNRRGREEDRKLLKALEGDDRRPAHPVGPGLCVEGIAYVLAGPFDGREATTEVRTENGALPILGETPYELIVPCFEGQASISENGRTWNTEPVHRVKMDVSVSKSRLRRHERATATLKIEGLKGYERPVRVRLENTSTTVVELPDGDVQTFTFEPAEWRRTGAVTQEVRVRGRRVGATTIRTTLLELP